MRKIYNTIVNLNGWSALADHLEGISHERINRYLRSEKLTPRLLWDNVKPLLQLSANAYIVFDDTVLDKCHSAVTASNYHLAPC